MLKGLAVELGRNIAAPLGKRIGTAIAAYLLAQGIPQEMTDQFLLAVGVVAGLSLDVLATFLLKKRV